MQAGSEKIRHGTPIATVVHSEEDIAVYQKAQDALEELHQGATSLHLVPLL